MTGAAHRHNWRRIESAITATHQQDALADLQLLLQRGYKVNETPYGTTPLCLAAAVGNLPAAQFLYVRGANPHLAAGRPAALPVEVAAAHGHLRIVQLLIENGSYPARSLHFAAANGHTNVVKFLIMHGTSPHLCVNGLSAVAVALLSGQHRIAAAMLPSCRPEFLSETL